MEDRAWCCRAHFTGYALEKTLRLLAMESGGSALGEDNVLLGHVRILEWLNTHVEFLDGCTQNRGSVLANRVNYWRDLGRSSVYGHINPPSSGPISQESARCLILSKHPSEIAVGLAWHSNSIT